MSKKCIHCRFMGTDEVSRIDDHDWCSHPIVIKETGHGDVWMKKMRDCPHFEPRKPRGVKNKLH